MGKAKTPKHSVQVDAAKAPKSRAIPKSPENIVWSFAVLDNDGPFAFSKCESLQKLIEILFWKQGAERMSFQDIFRGGSHEIELHKLCKEARDRLQEISLDDLDTLLSFRLTGKNRLWGIREQNVIRVLWWDPEHLVCPAALKHT
jgi:hypothetical protein